MQEEKLNVPKRLLRPLLSKKQLGLWAYNPQVYWTKTNTLYIKMPSSKRAKVLFIFLTPLISVASRSDDIWYDLYETLYERSLGKVPTVELSPEDATYKVIEQYLLRSR